MSIKVTKDSTKAILASIRALTKDRVLVGIPAEGATREPDADDPHPDINNAEIGYLNEFGEPALNIPARPHLVPGVEKITKRVEELYRAGAKAALDGNASAIDKAHMKVGMVAASSVQETITDGGFAPLAKATLAKRKAAGRTGEKPLLDTGQYRRAITYVVRKAGKKS